MSKEEIALRLTELIANVRQININTTDTEDNIKVFVKIYKLFLYELEK